MNCVNLLKVSASNLFALNWMFQAREGDVAHVLAHALMRGMGWGWTGEINQSACDSALNHQDESVGEKPQANGGTKLGSPMRKRGEEVTRERQSLSVNPLICCLSLGGRCEDHT